MSNVNEAVVRYLEAWSERDAKRRRDLVAQTFTEDGTYIDRVREGRGHDGIDAMIAKAQGQFPGYSLHLASGIEAHHDYVRFSWVAGGSPIKGPSHYPQKTTHLVGSVSRLPAPRRINRGRRRANVVAHQGPLG